MSTSLDIEVVIDLGRSKQRDLWNRGKDEAKLEYVRIDLVQMFDDGWLKAGSFANLSTNADFDKFFESGFSFEFAQSSGINYDRCKTASVKQKEMLLGGRGVWWTRYVCEPGDSSWCHRTHPSRRLSRNDEVRGSLGGCFRQTVGSCSSRWTGPSEYGLLIG